jgi:hypothetical protein
MSNTRLERQNGVLARRLRLNCDGGKTKIAAGHKTRRFA